MIKLLKYLKPYYKVVIAIFCVLLVQVYCDLSLPAYTSDIVNVGIQQGGIKEPIPSQISEEDMNMLFLFMSEEEQEEILTYYQEDSTSFSVSAYVLKEGASKEQNTLDTLAKIFEKPMLITMGLQSNSDQTMQMSEAIMSQVPANMQTPDMTVFDVLRQMPEEMRTTMLQKMNEEMESLPENMMQQASMAYIKGAYQRLDIDTNSIQTRFILTTGGKMLALALLGMLASVIVGLLAARTAASMGRDLRGKVFRKVVGFSNAELDKFSIASLITRSTNDIQQIQLLSVMLLRMVLMAPLTALGGIYRVFQTNISMSWIIGLAVGIILFIVIILFNIVMPKFNLLQNLVDRLNMVTREVLTGLPVIRAFHREKYEEERFDKANIDLTKMNLFVNRAMTFMMPLMMLVMNGVSVLIVWTGASGIDKGQMQVGDVMAFISYAMQIIMSFLMLCMVSIMLPRAAVSANRVNQVLQSETSIHDPIKPQSPKKGPGEVEFENVSFRYPEAEEDILKNISFTAKPGETTAIIGSTGSGKTTLVNLLPRFYDVTEGKIMIDKQNIEDISLHDLREKLGYVPQKGVLFSGTIASNICFSDENIQEEEMKRAAQIAQADDFIEEKKEQYESDVSQGGTNVSGGQKQRLSIARAIAKKPPIYIFDDSFSALDYKTDIALRRALKKNTANSTVIIIAQRINTIIHAEQIIVLEDGEIAGIGTHQELLKSCDAYYQIASSQLSEDELERDLSISTVKGGAHYE